MSRKMIAVEESFAAWREDAKYVAAYDAVKDEFTSAAAMLGARPLAELSVLAESG
jgi:hypothetical protein